MTEHVQVAVVGAGPAGLSAAITAALHGASVVLYDENDEPGGQLRYRMNLNGSGSEIANGRRFAATLADRAKAVGVELRLNSRVWGVFQGKTLGVESDESNAVVEAKRIILTTGSVDRSFPFPGGSLPGVFTARAVQLLLNRHGVRPGRRFALIANDPLAAELTRDVERAVGEVVVVIPPGTKGLRAFGDDGIERIVVIDETYEIDVVVIGVGRLADAGLALMAECAAGSLAGTVGYVPKVDARLETTVTGIFAAGDAIGPTTVELAAAEGHYLGISVAESLALVAEMEMDEARAVYHAMAGDRVDQLAHVTPVHVQVDQWPKGKPPYE